MNSTEMVAEIMRRDGPGPIPDPDKEENPPGNPGGSPGGFTPSRFEKFNRQ